ncbi:sulfotransferase [Gilvimarinus agarilyticus]|uniref:tetratricopeptide repeat-containing sulfotransferase family protein n=1 Tax=Gilvimarinus sp. 2_MG-2023 TaxID=3062666 RepID=UPI001C086303|nr:tetratricopeptide repeat-containing sulfotransferase family protein [Gilvimarinus sp. 2_MG-2023]MBU2884501.1 sulfotransferase [Gilvimarinus agarilyticus]MDO6569630.1 sulfotransferase [Gilvimarinus sp. 2_MG-2023]
MQAIEQPHYRLLRQLAECQAYPALLEACAHEAGSTEVDSLRALALAQLGEAQEAEQLLQLLNAAPITEVMAVDMAGAYLALGHTDRAEPLLRRPPIADAPTESLRLARLGLCQLQQNHPREALEQLLQSIVQHPRITVFAHALRLCANPQNTEQGEQLLAAAKQHWLTERANWPEDGAAFYDQQLRGLRLDLWLVGDAFDAAETWLEEQRHTLPESDWCHLLMGYAQRLQQRDRHTEAEERLRAGLNHYPQHRPLLLQLAELAQLQGRKAQANALVRKAINAAGQAGEPTTSLWLRLVHNNVQNNAPLAEHALAKARQELDALPADSMTDSRADSQQAALEFQYRLGLAGLYGQQQSLDKAEAEYRQLLSEQPDNLGVLQGLGQLLMQLGRIDEAIEYFETLKTQDPARGHAALINASRYPEDDATLQQLEDVAHTPGQEGSVRASLLLQLAKTYEKRKDYPRAMELANQANSAAQRLLNYAPKAHRQRCARIRHAFNAEFFKYRPPAQYGLITNVPVFVVGMPRSGTTLVEQILAGHSEIHGAGELGLIPGAIAGMERWERRTGSGRRYPDCADDLSPKVAQGIAQNLLDELQSYAPEAKHVVDKLPHNFENVGLIKFLFPNAKIISVRRDPRDIALSNYFTDYAAKHGGMGFAYDLDWIGEQLADHNLLMHHWQQVLPGEILEVQYEEVIANPEASAKKMLEYIGVSWEADVLNFADLNRPVKTASVWQVRQPIYQTSKAKWRRYQNHLEPLISATNRKITWEPIRMTSLPKPGWLDTGVDHYNAQQFNKAERCFKQLLHFVPEHGAANFMLGLVYANNGLLADAIGHMEQGLERCPWNRDWRNDLARAYRLNGDENKADALFKKRELENEINTPEDIMSDTRYTTPTSSGVY